MIVHTLKLTNFGRLAEVTVVFGESTVGIEGKSGVGKSTLMHALRFAVTGDLPDTVSSYRKDGGKHGKTVVDMTFSQKGQSFRILRGITKTSTTREFYEPGAAEPVTSAKEVDRRMLELFGADPKAIEGCVFVPQGKIDEVLFGNDTERETRFMKMLSLTHIGAISRAIDTQLGVLRSQVVDFAPAMQEVENNTSVVQNQLDELLRAASRTPVVQPSTITTLEGQIAMAASLQSLMVQVSAEAGSLRNKHEAYVAAKSREASLITLLADARSAAASRSVSRAACLQWIDASQKLAAASYEASRAAENLRQKQEHLSSLPAKSANHVQELRDAFAEKKAKVDSWEKALSCHRHVQGKRAELARLESEELAVNKAVEDSKAMLDKANAALAACKTAIDPEIAGLKFRKGILSGVHQHGNVAQCPVCNSKFQRPDDLASWLSEVEEKLQTLELELAKHVSSSYEAALAHEQSRRAVADLQVKLSNARHVTNIAEQAWEAHSPAVREMVMLPSIDVMISAEKTTLGIMQEDGKKAVEQSAAYSRAAEAVTSATTEMQRCNAVVSAANDQLKWSEENLFKVTGLRSVTSDNPLLLTSQEEGVVDKLQADVDAGHAIIAAYEKEESSVSLKCHEAEALRISLSPFMPGGATTPEALQTAAQEWQTQLEQLRALVREADNRRSQTDLLMKQLEECRQRKANIAASMERQAHLTSAIQRLTAVAKSFERTGAVRDFMRDKFAMLMHLINTHLVRMAAPFECRPADKPMSFEFRRTDEESEWMDQCKLSGGQRVRASVAFLLAVQSLVIPDVGLLMLDEPSMHLDQESQENLRDLISNLAESLRREEKQLVVVDHCPVLMPAFRRVITL